MSNITNITNSWDHDLPSKITLLIIAMCVYAIGIYLNTKIMMVSKREKDMTWKLDVTNSILVTIQYTYSMGMHISTNMIQDLHLYTNKWFCYVSLVIQYYLLLYIVGHSMIIALMKYVVIVCDEKIRNFGRERVKEIFFWIDFLHPSIQIAALLIARIDFVSVYGGFTTVNKCLGEAKNTTTLLSLCNSIESIQDHDFEYTLYIFKKTICLLHTIVGYCVTWNILDVFFYWLIFSYACR